MSADSLRDQSIEFKTPPKELVRSAARKEIPRKLCFLFTEKPLHTEDERLGECKIG
jgi:hypothetical protein